MKTRISFVELALGLLSMGAGATTVCRRVNESGQTQLAEVVPAEYKKVAICTDSQQYELSPEQGQAAERRTAEDKARARTAAAKLLADRASSAPRPARAASRTGPERPTEVVTDATDCTTWWRIYDESAACFGPYRTTRGAIEVDGFDNCNVVASPVPKCGPRIN